MDNEQHDPAGKQSAPDSEPANPGINGKAERPDPDVTDPATLPTDTEEVGLPLEDSRFSGEHTISTHHAEPTDVTGTSNDNYIEGEYIDVGGGD
ncbi:MAG: hypothetical protein JWQ98_2584 [Chlorobi bacterium]|nr:hypothetical protein [Chlorobiota bacterium]